MKPWLPDVEETRAIWAVLAALAQDVTDLEQRVSALEARPSEDPAC